MQDFWVTFTGKAKSGSFRAASLELARAAAEDKFGEAVRTIDVIPYPAYPIMYWSGAPKSDFQPRCSDPMRCRGKRACPKQPACTE